MLYIAAGVVVVSILADRSPIVFLSGLGALTAVLMLVFRDTILSLVASLQIMSNDMIRIGDWVEMPQANADGDVIDIALHIVKSPELGQDDLDHPDTQVHQRVVQELARDERVWWASNQALPPPGSLQRSLPLR